MQFTQDSDECRARIARNNETRMISMADFDFVHRQEDACAHESFAKPARKGAHRRDESISAANAIAFTVDDRDRLLRIIAQSTRVMRHYDLLGLLQGADVQHFIPHNAMIASWGDLGWANPGMDISSAVPGMRTGLLSHCSVDAWLKELYVLWLRKGGLPVVADSGSGVRIANSGCGCTLHLALRGYWSVLVHVVMNERDGTRSLYAALSVGMPINERSIKRFPAIADQLIAQIDVAYRRITPMRCAEDDERRNFNSGFRSLSAREREILQMLATGKTNLQIAQVLGISAFTVKNHLQRIMRKLDAVNRTEAVTMYHRRAWEAPAIHPDLHSPAATE